MADVRLTKASGDYLRGFASEDGKNVRVEKQNLKPAIDRAQLIREASESAKSNIMGRRYVGSVPATVLHDWLKKHGYTMHDWAINAGGSRNEHGDPMFHQIDQGVKSKFLRYFLSRDFSKLHTNHSTTRVGTGNKIYTGD